MNFQITQRYSVSGMHCAACANSVSSLLKSETGVSTAEVHFASSSATVQFNTAETNLQRFHELLQPFGFDVLPDQAEWDDAREQKQRQDYERLLRRNYIAWLCAVPVMILSMWMDIPAWTVYIQLVLTAVSLVYSGGDFFVHGSQQAAIRRVSMDTLIALSTGLAFLWSVFVMFAHSWLMDHGLHAHVAFESAVMVIAFVVLGKVLEEKAKATSASAVEGLRALQPQEAQVRRDGALVKLKISELRVGDLVVVSVGERVPVDGLVREGDGGCDERMLSGESGIVAKNPGDRVFAGTDNVRGTLIVEARSVGDETLLGYIRNSVRDAQDTKIAAQRLVDFVSERFVPAIILVAILSFALWLLFGGISALPQALNALIAVLVVACPCALGLAAPTAIMVGVGRAAAYGILVRKADVLERASTVDDVVFDKTGTLSTSIPKLENARWFRPRADQLEMLSLLYAMEMHSKHPIAKALCKALEELPGLQKNLALDSCTEFSSRGMQAVYKGRTYVVGSLAFVQQQLNLLSSGEEGILMADSDGEILAIPLKDGVLATTQSSVAELRELGYGLHILSGDRADSVLHTAMMLGIQDAQAQCTPDDKAARIREMQSQSRIVAMVGDGVNDAQSLALADYSIAMGHGTDIAMNASDVVLLNSSMKSLVRFFELSSATRRIIRQNLAWAFLYNLLLVPLAAGLFFPLFGWQLDPMYAGAAMALSSISVVTNSLRLRSLRID